MLQKSPHPTDHLTQQPIIQQSLEVVDLDVHAVGREVDGIALEDEDRGGGVVVEDAGLEGDEGGVEVPFGGVAGRAVGGEF